MKRAEVEGFEPTGPFSDPAVFKTAALNRSATPPGEAPALLFVRHDSVKAPHVRSQRNRHDDAAICLLVVLQDRDERAADGQAWAFRAW